MRMVRTRRRSEMTTWASRAGLVAMGAAGTALATALDKRRRNIARDRAVATVRRGADQAGRKARFAAGFARRVAHTAGEVGSAGRGREFDDVTLLRKVETEIFRPADAPKGSVSVNVQHGVVELRGEVKRPEDVKALGDAAAKVEGVRDVHNLLHTPGSPPKHSPVSSPDEVHARAYEPTAHSRFARNPATTPPENEPMVSRAGGEGGSAGTS